MILIFLKSEINKGLLSKFFLIHCVFLLLGIEFESHFKQGLILFLFLDSKNENRFSNK